MPSRRYNNFKKSLDELEEQFLDFDKDPLGNYSNINIRKSKAFVLLAHAEIESFLELTAEHVLIKAEKKWKSDLYSKRVIVSLLAYRADKSSISDEIHNTSGDNSLISIGCRAIENQKTIIKRNNGIRNVNLSGLFTPLGVQDDEIPIRLAINLDGLGKIRGELAHHGQSYLTVNALNPFDEKKNVKEIKEDLLYFDKYMNRYI